MDVSRKPICVMAGPRLAATGARAFSPNEPNDGKIRPRAHTWMVNHDISQSSLKTKVGYIVEQRMIGPYISNEKHPSMNHLPDLTDGTQPRLFGLQQVTALFEAWYLRGPDSS